MIKFHKISQIERDLYQFEDAVVKSDVLNGAFGEVTDGEFEVAENGTKAVMQVEVGDDECMDEYKIPANSHVRVIDFNKMADRKVEFYGFPLPAVFAKGDKLASDATGKLATGASAAPYFEIEEIIGNKAGVVAKVVLE